MRDFNGFRVDFKQLFWVISIWLSTMCTILFHIKFRSFTPFVCHIHSFMDQLTKLIACKVKDYKKSSCAIGLISLLLTNQLANNTWKQIAFKLECALSAVLWRFSQRNHHDMIPTKILLCQQLKCCIIVTEFHLKVLQFYPQRFISCILIIVWQALQNFSKILPEAPLFFHESPRIWWSLFNDSLIHMHHGCN